MKFKNTLEDFHYDINGAIINNGKGKIANSEDLFFRAKQNEIYDQYCAARIFLSETELQDGRNDAFMVSLTKMYADDKDMGLYLKSIFYESALIYYNIVVDLSWVLTYICIENYYLNFQYDVVPLKGYLDVKMARRALEEIEINTVGPDDEKNIFKYIKSLTPEFDDALKLITEFWKNDTSNIIRSRYNHIKHRNKPLYTEIEDPRISNMYAITSEGLKQIASGIADVSERYSLNDAIRELKGYDENILHTYISNLVSELSKFVKPSIV